MLPKSQYRHALNDYSEAANEATKRTRFMALLLMFASAITLISLRNSLDTAYFVRNYVTLHNSWEQAVRDTTLCRGISDKENTTAVVFSDTASLRKKFPFLADRNIYTWGDYNDRNEINRNVLKEAYLVRIPILGVAFHINDLSAVSTLSFIILLVIFYFFLLSEEDALRKLFHIAEQTDKRLMLPGPDTIPDEHRRKCKPYLQHYYNLHSARQVLTITPDSVISKQKKLVGWVKGFSYLLLTLPAISCALVFAFDVSTFERSNGLTEILLCGLLTTLVLGLNWYCVVTARKTDNTWKTRYEQIKEARQYEDGLPGAS